MVRFGCVAFGAAAFGFAVLGVGLLACTPTLDDPTAIVSSPRLLAVQATPAEGALGASFTLTALYVGPNGPADPSGIDWATCWPKAPANRGPINAGCFVDASLGLAPSAAASSRRPFPRTRASSSAPTARPRNPGSRALDRPIRTRRWFLPAHPRKER